VDTVTLVSDQLEEGERLLKALPQQGFEVAGAFWIRPAEDDRWYFYLVSPLAETERLATAYSRLHTAIRRLQPRWIDPLEVQLIGPTDPLARDVFAIHQRAPGPRLSPLRWGGKQLGNLGIEGAYLYPLPDSPAS
jgi:hypothetical protein